MPIVADANAGHPHGPSETEILAMHERFGAEVEFALSLILSAPPHAMDNPSSWNGQQQAAALVCFGILLGRGVPHHEAVWLAADAIDVWYRVALQEAPAAGHG